MASTWEDPEEIDVDLYSVLGVSRQADAQEIKANWRKLVRQAHPDKNKSSAHSFEQIDYAYKVLSDPQKRRVYDEYGHKGLKLWPTTNTKSTAEQWAELMRIRDKKDREKAEKLSGCAGVSTIKISGPAIWNAKNLSTAASRAMKKLSMMETIQVSVSDKDTLTLSCSAQITPSRSQGVGLMNFQHRFSPTLVGTSTAWSRGTAYGGAIGFAQQISNDTVIEGSLGLDTIGGGINAAVKRSLTPTLVSSVYLSLGTIPQTMVAISEKGGTYPYKCALKIDPTNVSAIAQVQRTLMDGSKLYSGVSADYNSLTFRVGAKKNVLTYSSLSLEVGLGTRGITLTFGYARLGQRFEIPVLLSEVFSPLFGVASVLLPAAFVALLKRFVFDPHDMRAQESILRAKRIANRAVVAEQKASASTEVQEMTEEYNRIRGVEEAASGLVITRAIYGNLKASAEDKREFDLVVDVTIPLQCLVQTRQDISSITVEAHTKASLAGFYDPDPGQEKQLEVWYNYGGKLHHVIIDDLQRLRIPLMSHEMPN